MTKPAKGANTTRGATMELTVANAAYAATHEATPAEVVQRELDARRAAQERPVRQPRATKTTPKTARKTTTKKTAATKRATKTTTKTTPPVEGTE